MTDLLCCRWNMLDTSSNKKFEPTADAARVAEIRRTISECLAYARQKYGHLDPRIRADQYLAKKLRHLTDAAFLKEENPQQAEIHFKKAIGKSGLDWIEQLKLLAAH